MSDDTDPAASTGPEAGSDGADDRAEARRRIEAALRQVRREGWKAAILSAALEATVVFLAVNLGLAALGPDWLPERFALPDAVAEPIGDAVGLTVAGAGVPGSAGVAAALGAFVFGLGVWLRVRRSLVEQFEAANPPVAEKLRTARDAVAAGAETRMAARLYEEVLADLRESSGAALVDARRLAATVAVVGLLSVATVQVAVVDLALLDRGADAGEDDLVETPDNYTGLKEGDAVLGDREEVSAGEQNQTAQVESTGGDQEVNESDEFPQSAGGGSEGTGGVDGQQAGYAPPEQVDDAELVREYNHRIRQDDDSDD